MNGIQRSEATYGIAYWCRFRFDVDIQQTGGFLYCLEDVDVLAADGWH